MHGGSARKINVTPIVVRIVNCILHSRELNGDVDGGKSAVTAVEPR